MSPTSVSAVPDQSLGGMFLERARRYPEVHAFRVKDARGEYGGVSFKEAGARVEAIAAGLLSISGGLPARSSLAILGETSMPWILVDFATLSLDVIVVPIYPSLLPPEVGFICNDAAVEVAVVDDKEQLDKLRAVKSGFSFLDKGYGPLALRHYVVIDPKGVEPATDWESLADLEARGRARLEDSRAERNHRLAAIDRHSIATYAYTSGTTGAPKGVIQTHHNWLSMLEITPELGLFTEASRQHGGFLFLPLAHSFGRLVELTCAYNGGPAVLASIPTLAEDLAKSRPGLLPAAPRVYEKIYGRIMAGVASAPPHRQKLFSWALSVGKQAIPYRRRGKSLPLLLGVQHRLAERLVYRKLRARLGLDKLENAVTGSAPLAPVVHEFFLAMGIMLIEGYGLTETCPVLTANRLDRWKLQTVGTPIKNVTIKLAADGEILAKGPNVTQGYLNRPDANADAFDAEGWFHTGDIGEFDGEGFLHITDRKKDLLKTSGGKYIAPVKIEGMLKSMPMVGEAVVLGDNRKYCTALLVLDEDGIKAWAERTGNPPEPRHPALLAAIQKSLDEVNRDLASFESIKYFRVLEHAFTVDNGLLTASFKVKRKEVNKRYAELIEEMYAEGAGPQSRAA